MAFIRFLWWTFVGLCVGALILFVFYLILETASAQELTPTTAVPIRESTLGEQHRALTTEQPRYRSPEQVGEFMGAIAIDDVSTTTRLTCENTNEYLLYLLKDLAAYIATHPEAGPEMRPAIEAIHSSWCTL